MDVCFGREWQDRGHWENVLTWWRHQMETFSALLALCAGNSPVSVNSPHKGQWRGALMFSLICSWIHDWVNNRETGDLRRHRAHYDVIVMILRLMYNVSNETHMLLLSLFFLRLHACMIDLPCDLRWQILSGLLHWRQGNRMVVSSRTSRNKAVSVMAQQNAWTSWRLKSPTNVCLLMMTSSNGNIFRFTGPLCGEFTGHPWIPRTKASDSELWWFLWSTPE